MAEDYESDKVAIEELYQGYLELKVEAGVIDGFMTRGGGAARGVQVQSVRHPSGRPQPFPHRHRQVRWRQGKAGADKEVAKDGIWSIHSRNREQAFTLDLLLDDSVKLVTLVGKAGTGKTLLAIAAGLHKTAEENVYNRLLVSRPVFPMGKDLGFLPGDIEEKLAPWMQPIFDNVELLLVGARDGERQTKGIQGADGHGDHGDRAADVYQGAEHSEPVHDRRQGAEPHAARDQDDRHAGGEGTKIVLTGDPTRSTIPTSIPPATG